MHSERERSVEICAHSTVYTVFIPLVNVYKLPMVYFCLEQGLNQLSSL